MSKTGLVLVGLAIVNKDGKFFNGWDNGPGWSSGEAIWCNKPSIHSVLQINALLEQLKSYGELATHPVYVDFGP